MTDTFNSVSSARLEGLSSLLRKLKTFPEKLQKKGLNAAVRKGAAVVRKAAISNAKRLDDPATSEMIWKNVATQYSGPQSKRQGGVVIRVGIRGGARKYGDTRENRRKQRVGKSYKTAGDKGNPGGDTFYWRFLEFGFRQNQGLEFMTSALEDNVDKATEAVSTELSKQIDKLAASSEVLK